MKYTKAEKLRMLRFLSDARESIWKTYSEHQQEEGYVVVRVSPDFTLAEKPLFAKRRFRKADFKTLLEEEEEPTETAASGKAWYYYELWWSHNNHVWRIKENLPKA